MKIDVSSPAVSQPPVERSNQQTAKGNSVGGPTKAADWTTLKSDSTAVKSLTRQALQSPEIRQGKVDAVRQAISSGAYQLDSKRIANAIIDGDGK